MKTLTASDLKNAMEKVGKKARVNEQDVAIFSKVVDIVANKQPNGVLKVTKKNCADVFKQIGELELELARQTKADSFMTLKRWEEEWYEFTIKELDKLMKKSCSPEMKIAGLKFLQAEYAKMEDILVELYILSNIITDFGDKKIPHVEVENIFGEGFKYERYYPTGDKGIVKHIDENSHIHVMSIALPREQPIVFPIVSFDTALKVDYNSIAKGDDCNIHFSIELNELNPKALNFRFAIY